MPWFRPTAGLLIAMPLIAGVPAAAQKPPPPERVSAIAAMLAEHPAGVGRPITDRAAWESPPMKAAAGGVIAEAEKLLAEPIPDQPDDLFLEFSKTGNRTHWQDVSGRRRGRVTTLVLAECLENKGRFVPAFEQVVAALCAERTWLMPAHDGNLANFQGKTIDIDLASSALGWDFATADYWLGERLSPPTRQLLRDNVVRRVVEPYRAMARAERPLNWWMLTTNNWNAVCLAGVTGAALALLDSREDRAFFIAAAEQYSRNFLKGFTSDGYCSEGVGYWDYGFGHYVLLAETIRQATGGGVDLFAGDAARVPATYGARIEIINGVCPAFADCGVTARPDARIMQFVNRIYGLGLPQYAELDESPGGALSETGIRAFPNSASQAPPAQAAAAGQKLRDWFDQAGILIARPGEGGTAVMGVALKGGHNAEHHNHNDVGSYVVVLGARPVLLDPGSETYTARTFSARRYESNVLNSYGHPVPIVAGKLQREGRDAQGKVLQADFTDQTDTLKLDIASAYPVPELKKLERTFVYSREGRGSLKVTDAVAFATPQAFGTAFITLGEWRRFDVAQRGEPVEPQTADNELVVYDFDQAVRVKIEASGPVKVGAAEIKEDCYGHPKRIGIDLAEPTTEATISVTITPLESSEDEHALRNGGFELGTFGWDLGGGSLASISSEQAAEGHSSLKIVDQDRTQGSSVTSARVTAEPNAKYELRGQVYPVSGDGVGLYVLCLDAEGRRLNPTDEKGNIANVGSLGGDAKEWKAFVFPFETPPKTTHVQVWVHSYTGAVVEAYLDELAVVKTKP